MKTVCLFEDQQWQTLLPITWLHTPWELLVGARTIAQRVKDVFPDARLTFLSRPWLRDVLEERHGLSSQMSADEQILYINARILDVEGVREAIAEGAENIALWRGDTLLAARCHGIDQPEKPEDISSWIRHRKLAHVEEDIRLFDYWWELIHAQEEMLNRDFLALDRSNGQAMDRGDFQMIGSGDIHIAEDARIEPGAILDARSGPIRIECGAQVGMGAVIVGPVFFGPHTLIKPLSHIGPMVSLGPYSRVGGEVARSIFLGYANKQHHGFLGHTYVGNWVNFGAGTTNSNLKNTYGSVKVWSDGSFRDSGEAFIGCAVGDHSKTAINTVINTGTVIGVSSNLFESGFPPKFVPSFSWGGGETAQVYDLERAVRIASTVMERRGRIITSLEQELLAEVWHRSSAERSYYSDRG